MKKLKIAWQTEGMCIARIIFEPTISDKENVIKAQEFLAQNPKMTTVAIIPEGKVEFVGDDFRYDVILLKASEDSVLLYAQDKWDSSMQVESEYFEI